jgi:hypothetical protein
VAPTPPPTPHPALAGANYDTFRALARFLDTEMQHALTGAEKAAAGLRPMRLVSSNLRMFARRVRTFQTRVEGYRTAAFDVAQEVTALSNRTQALSRRLRRMNLFEHTNEDWDAMADALGRMQKLLAGQAVTVPPAHTPRPVPSVPPLLRRPGAMHGDRMAPGRTRPPEAPAAERPSPSPTAPPSPEAR